MQEPSTHWHRTLTGLYGKMTKKISEIQALEKAYTGTITLGATTPSYDLETAIDQNFPTDHITKNS